MLALTFIDFLSVGSHREEHLQHVYRQICVSSATAAAAQAFDVLAS